MKGKIVSLLILSAVAAMAAEPDPAALLRDLSSDVFKTREAAAGALREWADREPKVAEELFAKHLDADTDPEARVRCRDLLKHVVLLEYRKQGEGYIGIQMSEEQVAPAVGDEPAVFGIRITMVVPDTPAAKAGLQPGDLLLSLEGKGWSDVNVIERFGLEIRKRRPGDRIKLRVRHGAGDKEVEVELARRPPEAQLLQNGLLLGGIGIARPDLDLLSREQARLQAAAEETFFQEWLARRKQGKTPTPGPTGQD